MSRACLTSPGVTRDHHRGHQQGVVVQRDGDQRRGRQTGRAAVRQPRSRLRWLAERYHVECRGATLPGSPAAWAKSTHTIRRGASKGPPGHHSHRQRPDRTLLAPDAISSEGQVANNLTYRHDLIRVDRFGHCEFAPFLLTSSRLCNCCRRRHREPGVHTDRNGHGDFHSDRDFDARQPTPIVTLTVTPTVDTHGHPDAGGVTFRTWLPVVFR